MRCCDRMRNVSFILCSQGEVELVTLLLLLCVSQYHIAYNVNVKRITRKYLHLNKYSSKLRLRDRCNGLVQAWRKVNNNITQANFMNVNKIHCLVHKSYGSFWPVLSKWGNVIWRRSCWNLIECCFFLNSQSNNWIFTIASLNIEHDMWPASWQWRWSGRFVYTGPKSVVEIQSTCSKNRTNIALDLIHFPDCAIYFDN